MLRFITILIFGYFIYKFVGRLFTTNNPRDSYNHDGVNIDHAPENDMTTQTGEYIDYEEVRKKD